MITTNVISASVIGGELDHRPGGWQHHPCGAGAGRQGAKG